MPVESVADKDGFEMLMRRTPRGIYIPIIFNEDTVDSLTSLDLRQDDIFLCSFPKAGCHWVWEILRLMTSGLHVHGVKVEKESHMIEASTEQQLQELASPRILNNHLAFKDQPADLVGKKVKVVYVYRNLKDIAVSFFHHHKQFTEFNHYHGDFNNYLNRFTDGFMDCGGNVLDYMQSWDLAIGQLGDQVHVMAYEDLKGNTMSELKRLDTFLGTGRDEKFLRELSLLTDFSSMEKNKNFSNLPGMLDEHGKHRLYRKGEVGDWKNYFTVAQSQRYDKLIQDRLGGLKFHSFTYQL